MKCDKFGYIINTTNEKLSKYYNLQLYDQIKINKDENMVVQKLPQNRMVLY